MSSLFPTASRRAAMLVECAPTRRRPEVSPFRRVRDAYAALAYSRTLPYVDGSRVGLMGGSPGSTQLFYLATLTMPAMSSSCKT